MKKNLTKIASMLLAAAMGLTIIAGCSSTTQNSGDDANTTANNSSDPASIETVSDGQLIMGTNAAFPPFEYTTTDGLVGDFDGIDVAIAKKIADSMGKELVINDQEFDGLIAAVSTGKVDMAVAGMTITPERQENVDFSDTYYAATQVMLVSPDNTTITKAEDLKNATKVGVVLGYTGDNIVTDTLQLSENQIQRANRAIDIVMELKNGKLDAVVVDSATGKALAEKNDLKVVEDPEVFDTEEYAIAVRKGNTALLEQINTVLAEMKANGEIEQLAEEYDNKQ